MAQQEAAELLEQAEERAEEISANANRKAAKALQTAQDEAKSLQADNAVCESVTPLCGPLIGFPRYQGALPGHIRSRSRRVWTLPRPQRPHTAK